MERCDSLTELSPEKSVSAAVRRTESFNDFSSPDDDYFSSLKRHRQVTPRKTLQLSTSPVKKVSRNLRAEYGTSSLIDLKNLPDPDEEKQVEYVSDSGEEIEVYDALDSDEEKESEVSDSDGDDCQPHDGSIVFCDAPVSMRIAVDILLSDIYDPSEESPTSAPRNRWYPLKGKAGKKDEHKYRGELELRIQFFCKPVGLGQPGSSPTDSSLTSGGKEKKRGSVGEENFAQKVGSGKRKLSSPATVFSHISTTVNSAEEKVKRRIRKVSLSNVLHQETLNNNSKSKSRSKDQRRPSLPARNSSVPSFCITENSPSNSCCSTPSAEVKNRNKNSLTLPSSYRGARSFGSYSGNASPLPALKERGECTASSEDENHSTDRQKQISDDENEEIVSGLGITKEQRRQLRKQAALTLGEPYVESPKTDQPPKIVVEKPPGEKKRQNQQRRFFGNAVSVDNAGGEKNDIEDADENEVKPGKVNRSMSLAAPPTNRTLAYSDLIQLRAERNINNNANWNFESNTTTRQNVYKNVLNGNLSVVNVDLGIIRKLRDIFSQVVEVDV